MSLKVFTKQPHMDQDDDDDDDVEDAPEEQEKDR